METITVRDVVLGEGRPGICVPIMGQTAEELLKASDSVKKVHADIVEWRADFFTEAMEPGMVLEMLALLRRRLADIPILFTFRTRGEGGRGAALPLEQYGALLEAVISSELADMVDIEHSTGMGRALCGLAGERVRTVISYHDFEKTPPEEEIIARLEQMMQCPADISKIALMPASRLDVVNLISAAVRMREKYPDRLLAAISMGGLGALTRIAGELMGTAITFGAVGVRSAPGQPDAAQLSAVLDMIHDAMSAEAM